MEWAIDLAATNRTRCVKPRINPAILDSYLSHGGADLVKDMIGFFQDTVPPRLDRLEKALDQKDWKDGKFVLHSLKNSFLNMGADPLAADCQKLEDEMANLPIESIALKLAHIKRGASEVHQELSEYANSH